MNLAATVPGWTRFSVAQDMLDRISTQQSSFESFIITKQMPTNDAERDVLFRDFLQWQQGAAARPK
jgi:hypothetical protein